MGVLQLANEVQMGTLAAACKRDDMLGECNGSKTLKCASPLPTICVRGGQDNNADALDTSGAGGRNVRELSEKETKRPGVLIEVDVQAAQFHSEGVSRGNAFGQGFRNYEQLQEWGRQCVLDNYRLNHASQTYEFVQRMHAQHLRFDKMKMGVWEAIELLNEVVDDSDPDTALPQIEHLLQTAEAIRKVYPEDDWFHLTGLLHDLGKVLAHPAFGSQPQWAVVGDTFPTGCAHDPALVYPHYFAANPDATDPRYNTKHGVYRPYCGLRQVAMSWGHDEYFYRVLQHNGCTLPPEGQFIIRYHSFYALHTHGAYSHLLDDFDRAMLPWLQRFQKFDLYSKADDPMDVPALKAYYMALIHKYFPKYELQW